MPYIAPPKEKPRKFLIPQIYNPEDFTDLVPHQRVFTQKDYDLLPEGAPYQLIGGSLVMTPAPEVYHQKVVGNLLFKLKAFTQKKGMGDVYHAPINVKLGKTEIYQPDIVFVSTKQAHIIGKKMIEGAPDVVMEVLSPSTAYYDLRVKYEVYERAGVKEYWIVDPNRKELEIYYNENNRFRQVEKLRNTGTASSVALKDFSVSLEEVF